MGIFSWIKKNIFGMSDKEAETIDINSIITQGQEELNGLNFKGAIDAHVKWKQRLESFIKGESEEKLKVEDIYVDNKCVLGKWIYGDGGKLCGDDINELKETHAAFHRNAGLVLSESLEGNKDKALNLLNEGDYATYSNRVKKLLLQLYVKMSDNK